MWSFSVVRGASPDSSSRINMALSAHVNCKNFVLLDVYLMFQKREGFVVLRFWLKVVAKSHAKLSSIECRFWHKEVPVGFLRSIRLFWRASEGPLLHIIIAIETLGIKISIFVCSTMPTDDLVTVLDFLLAQWWQSINKHWGCVTLSVNGDESSVFLKSLLDSRARTWYKMNVRHYSPYTGLDL